MGRQYRPRRCSITHTSRRPPSNVKERKFIANARGQIANLFGTITEYGDFIDALLDALPHRIKPGTKNESIVPGWYLIHGKGGKPFWIQRHEGTLVQKTQALWQNAEHIDFNAMLWNVAVNQLQDHLIGKFGKAQQDAARNWLESMGRPVGFGTGLAL